MAKEKPDVIYGTVEMLVLQVVQAGPIHGLAIADRIQLVSRDVLKIGQGSLYPALYRMVSEGLLAAEAGIAESNRKAQFYSLTAEGKKRLKEEKLYWAKVTDAVNLVLAEE